MPKQTFILNGKPVTVDVHDDVRVLWVLRDLLGVTGPKYGCGINVCKACTSHINGKAFNPCSVRVGDLKPDRRGHHDRGAAPTPSPDGPAPDAAGLARPRRRAVRLLPARPDHGRGRAGAGRCSREGREITDADLDDDPQHLPLRHLHPDPRGDRGRRPAHVRPGAGDHQGNRGDPGRTRPRLTAATPAGGGSRPHRRHVHSAPWPAQMSLGLAVVETAA